MKKGILLLLILLCVFSLSCKDQNQAGKSGPQAVINVELTDDEKAGGLMTPEILWKFSRLGSFTLSPDGSVIIYALTRYDLATENRITNIYKIPASGGDPVQLTEEGGSSPQWIENGKKIAFSNDGSLWTMNPDGTGLTRIEGLSDFEAFSISPDGNLIYFTRRVKLDQTANETYNLPKANVRIIDDLMYRHWNYWSDFSYSHIFVAGFDGRIVSGDRDIMEGQKYESPLSPNFDEAEIAWSPDSKHIAYTTKRLTGKADAISTNSDIYLYDLDTGDEVNISEGNMGYDRYPVFSPDGSMIAYQSMERDGYESDLDRLMVFDIKNNTNTWISEGWDNDIESITWEGNRTLYFVCSYLGTSQVFTITLQDRNVTKVTEGVHDLGPINLKSGVLIAGIMSMSMAPELSDVNLNTGEVRQITGLNNYIYDYIKMGNVEEKYIKTRDNKDLQMWVIYPPGFDPSKKYPLLLYCKGGPQGPLGQSWSYRWNYQMMAANQYIIVAPNRRGNSGFGQEWKEEISGDYGGHNMQDYLDATDAMAREAYVDRDRLGAVGASYGGFSVFYLAGIHQGRFKALIAHCGMFNFESWYGSTEELWFPDKDFGGPYWEDVESYKFSPHLMVDRWTAPILIITGQNDFRIPYTQSMEAFQAAQLRGIPSKLLFFEDETHFVSKPQNAVIWQNEFFNWLDTYLK